MFNLAIKKWGVLAAASLLTAQAFAARPFVTDDARLTTAGSCQLESWQRQYQNSREFWVLPACNLHGNFEVTMGAGYAQATASPSATDYVLQGKTLFQELSPNGWGWGLAVGKIAHPSINPGPNLLGNTYAYIPISRSFWDDEVIVHTNLGTLRDTATGTVNGTWGFGSEIKLTDRTLGIVEMFGDNHNRPYWQVGARYAVIPNLFQIDATVGKQWNGFSESRWFSVGIRFTPSKLW